MARHHSSGDLIADRRADYARHLAETGDPRGAAELVEQALELVPKWTAGWELLGRYREAAGDIVGAVAAWHVLAALDTTGVFGGALRLAAHGAGAAAGETPVAYVAALFDAYAESFDEALLTRLGYVVPERLASLIGEVEPRRFGRVLDLGCGTGLMGQQLRGRCDVLEGVDLSAGMIAVCRGKGIYDLLEVAELAQFLASEREASADLVAAADVLTYCGVLASIFAGVAAVLRPGGLLAFSIEVHDGPAAAIVQPTLRYAHRPDLVPATLAEAGLEMLRCEITTIRTERGKPVRGALVVARRG